MECTSAVHSVCPKQSKHYLRELVAVSLRIRVHFGKDFAGASVFPYSIDNAWAQDEHNHFYEMLDFPFMGQDTAQKIAKRAVTRLCQG